jgi:hypothetical protein
MSATTSDGVAPGEGSGSGPVPVKVESPDDLAEALNRAGLVTGVPVLVVVGGAGGMAQADLDAAHALARDHLLPLLAARSGVVVDGGTDSGVMAALGRARGESGLDVPLVGVAARGTVRLGEEGGTGSSEDDERAAVEPHHSHIVLVPGQEWGEESPWIAAVATALAGGAPSMTLVLNGGRITYDDVTHSLEARRPVLVLAGTGRTADEIASAATDPDGEHPRRAAEPAASPLVHVASLDDPSAIRSAVAGLLGSSG